MSRRVRVGLNALSILNRSGTGFYTTALVNYLRGHSIPDCEVVLFLPRHRDPALRYDPSQDRFGEGVTARFVAFRQGRMGRILAERSFASLAGEHRLDVLHSPTGIMPWSLPCQSVVTLHDMAFAAHPEDFTLSHRLFLGWSIPRSARKAALVLTDSEWSAGEITRRLGIDKSRLRVIPLGVDNRFFQPVTEDELGRVKSRYSLPNRFILYLGTIEPRKNLIGLVEALAVARREAEDIRLVIAGRRGWKVKPLERLISDLGLLEAVTFTGFVHEEDLPALYRSAAIFAYPSKYEGFGLPVVEAMASGTAVITSKGSSFPEVAGEAGRLVNAAEPTDIARAILELWKSRSARAALSKAGIDQARRFPWEDTAKITFGIVKKLALGEK